MMEERYHATTQNRFYPDMSNVNKNIAVEVKLISPPTYIYIIIFRSVLRIKIVPDTSLGENQSHISCSITFFDYHAVNEIMWEYTVQQDKPQMTIWRMRTSS